MDEWTKPDGFDGLNDAPANGGTLWVVRAVAVGLLVMVLIVCLWTATAPFCWEIP